MNKLFLSFVLVVLFGCKETPVKRIVTIKKGMTLIKGDINNGVYNDTILYYNLANDLIQKSYFDHGKQEGISFGYYRNGKLLSTTNYSDGLKNGYNSYFVNSSGKCFYRDFYYYGLPVGPIVYFDKDDNPKRYFFINLQNETLLDINYREWQGVRDIYTKCYKYRMPTARLLIQPRNFQYFYI